MTGTARLGALLAAAALAALVTASAQTRATPKYGGTLVGLKVPSGRSSLTYRSAACAGGSAALIPKLSSPDQENRPTLTRDGLEIFFFSTRPGGSGSSDLWRSSRPSLDAPWSTPVNLGPTVNSSDVDMGAYLSANGRTLVFSSNCRGGSGGTDLCHDAQRRIDGDGERPVAAVRAGEPAADVRARRVRGG